MGRHNLSYSPEYRTYQMAKDRCTNPNSQRWYTHGGRGIKMLFASFQDFYREVGNRPSSDYSIERIDNDGNYEVGNVRWATRSEQQKNKRKYTTVKRHGKGYYWHKGAGKWMSRIKMMGKEVYLGLFDTEEKAALAYQKKLTELIEKYEKRSC